MLSKIIYGAIIFVLFSSPTVAQYYYKDIVSSTQVREEFMAYKENNVRSVRIRSFEDDGSESEGFFCERKISKDWRRSELTTRAAIAPASYFVSTFDAAGRVLTTNDSSSISVSAGRYTYDDKGRVTSILSRIHSSDDDFRNEISEEHIYTYNEAGKPAAMERIVNGTNRTRFVFSHDEHGNVAIEKNTATGENYYYYYDSRGRLTDVVRGNDTGVRLKPDYMFEYNGAGKITQMTTVEEGSSHYFIWKYNYENGLRVKERCLTDERKLMGSIEYEYK